MIGATNLEEALDPAIKRPGRFDKIINIPLPDVKGREEIFDYYLKKIQHEENIDKAVLARQSSGYSGADIQNVVNLAILNAIKNSINVFQDYNFFIFTSNRQEKSKHGRF